MKRNRGFSLLEQMVVLAIGMVLLLVSIQSIRSAAGATRLQGDAATLARTLYMAKLRAGAEFTRTRVSVDTSASTYTIDVYDKATSAWVVDTGPLPLGIGVSFGAGSVTTAPPGLGSVTLTQPVTFNSRGMPVDGSGVPTGLYAVYLTDGSRVIVVRVSLGGRPSTLEFRSGAWSEV